MKNIIKALHEIQTAAQGIKATGKDSHRGNNYAKLSDVIAAITEPMKKSGVFMTQTQGDIITGESVTRVINPETGEITETVVKPSVALSTMTTSFYHVESGEVFEKTMTFVIQEQVVRKGDKPELTPQAMGIAMSYAKRYHLMSLLGLATDDNDGVLSEAVNKANQDEIMKDLISRIGETKTIDEVREVYKATPKSLQKAILVHCEKRNAEIDQPTGFKQPEQSEKPAEIEEF